MAFPVFPFYNLTESVGQGRANRLTDVMLVQFFLREIAAVQVGFPAMEWTSRPSTPLVVNGRADANLYQWIRSFQDVTYLNARDGVVDPAAVTERERRTPRQHLPYTIVPMNGLFKTFHPTRFPRLCDDPAVPDQLRAEIGIPLY